MCDATQTFPHTACFTGHRILPMAQISRLQTLVEQTVQALYTRQGVYHFLSGGARGFDLLGAMVVLNLKVYFPKLQLSLILPCQDHTKGWTKNELYLYDRILSRSPEIIYTSNDYFPGCMAVRNRYLVEHSSRCICYQTKARGGTAFTVSYAQKQGAEILNLADLL